MPARFRREADGVDETDGLHTTDDTSPLVASVTAPLMALSIVVVRGDMRLRAEGNEALHHKSST